MIQSISSGFGGGGRGVPSKRFESFSTEYPSCALIAYLRTLFAHSLYTTVSGEFMLIGRKIDLNKKDPWWKIQTRAHRKVRDALGEISTA
jgi:hypothetical protein